MLFELGDMSDIWRWVIANFLIFLIFCLLYQPLVLLISAAFFVCCGLRLEDHICPCENVTVQRFQLAGADFPKSNNLSIFEKSHETIFCCFSNI